VHRRARGGDAPRRAGTGWGDLVRSGAGTGPVGPRTGGGSGWAGPGRLLPGTGPRDEGIARHPGTAGCPGRPAGRRSAWVRSAGPVGRSRSGCRAGTPIGAAQRLPSGHWCWACRCLSTRRCLWACRGLLTRHAPPTWPDGRRPCGRRRESGRHRQGAQPARGTRRRFLPMIGNLRPGAGHGRRGCSALGRRGLSDRPARLGGRVPPVPACCHRRAGPPRGGRIRWWAGCRRRPGPGSRPAPGPGDRRRGWIRPRGSRLCRRGPGGHRCPHACPSHRACPGGGRNCQRPGPGNRGHHPAGP
jgi:hypothetical protein